MRVKTFLSVVLSVAAGLILAGCPCTPEIVGSVPNTLHPQQTYNWCWAAVTQMLAQHLGITITQCDLANHRFSRTDCCTNVTSGSDCPKNDSCNKPGWVDLDYAGAKSDEDTTALTWEQIRSQIYCIKKPMGYAYGTPGVVGHVIVIKGYITIGGTNYVVLNDPWPRCTGAERVITYNEYADPSGSATHWNTWYNIAKK
jgi:hypothetical protein